MAWQRTRISSLLCPFVGFSPGKHTLQREEGQYRSFTALTQLSYLISRASNGFVDKSNCSQWEQWAADELSVKQKTQTERHFKGFFFLRKLRISLAFIWISACASVERCNDKQYVVTLFSCTNCFIFPVKQPLCLGVLSVRRSDETQTDYLVWMAFPEQQKGQHNNR